MECLLQELKMVKYTKDLLVGIFKIMVKVLQQCVLVLQQIEQADSAMRRLAQAR